jgi:hypothetical protein
MAREHLDTLRASLDVRLSALEAALADPARGPSLEGLILGLARVATEEAEVAAARACEDAKQDADTQAARALAAAKASAQQNQAVIAELRRAVESARQRIAALEGERQGELRAVREGLEAQLARERESSARLERSLADARAELDAERAAHTGLRLAAEAVRKDLEAARGRIGKLEDEKTRAERAAAESAARLDALTRERTAAAPGEQTANAAARHAAAAPAPFGDDRWAPVRLADRHTFRTPIAVQLNGEPGSLVDLSVAGCQVVSRASVKPNQVLKVVLPSSAPPVVCSGKVVWARLEPSAGGRPAGYRAGVQFTKPDESAIAAFIAGHASG